MDQEKRKFLERLNEVVSLLGYQERGRQTQLAKYYDLKQPSVSRWFDGGTMPSYSICVDLCKRAGVCFEWFMTGRGEKKYSDKKTKSDPWPFPITYDEYMGLDDSMKTVIEGAMLSAVAGRRAEKKTAA